MSRRNYVNDQTKILESYKYNNAKLYWRLLKDTAKVKSPDIPLTSFEVYLKAVNNPDDPFFQPDADVLYFNERFVRDEFQTMFNELDTELSNAEITTAIKQLKSHLVRINI